MSGIFKAICHTLYVYRSPIFLGFGIAIGASCVAMTAYETVKACDIIEGANNEMDEVEESTSTDEEKDISKKAIRKKTNIALAKTYAIPALLGAGSTACILGAYCILSKEKAAAIAALSAVSAAFDKYRSRVIDKYGVEEDYNLYMGKEETVIETEVTDPKTGKVKKKKVKETTVNPIDSNCYSRILSSDTSKEWCFNQERLMAKLEFFQNSQNERLRKNGRMTYNEVCKELGLGCSIGYFSTDPVIPEGVGWLSQDILDAVADRFPGPYDSTIKYLPNLEEGYFDDGCKYFDGSYLLTFNCYPIDSMILYYEEKLRKGEIKRPD